MLSKSNLNLNEPSDSEWKDSRAPAQSPANVDLQKLAWILLVFRYRGVQPCDPNEHRTIVLRVVVWDNVWQMLFAKRCTRKMLFRIRFIHAWCCTVAVRYINLDNSSFTTILTLKCVARDSA
jgi:hypothetical protein